MGEDLISRIRLRITHTHVSGRAASQPELRRLYRPLPFADLPDRVCPAPSAPSVCPDGRVMACCSDTVSDPENWPALELGHVATDGYGELLDKADSDLLIQALRVFGPKHLAGVAIEAGALKAPKADSRNICDICRRVVTDERALAAVRDWLKRADVRAEISLRRFLMYEEVNPALNEAS